MLVASFRPDDTEVEQKVLAIGLSFCAIPIYSIEHKPSHIKLHEVLVVTSSNGLGAIVNIPELARVPFLVVGERTGKKARSLGLNNIIKIFEEGLELIQYLRSSRFNDIGYIRGEQVTYELHSHLSDRSITEYTVYQANYIKKASDKFGATVEKIDYMLLFSSNTALVLSQIAAHLNFSHITSIAISDKVDDALGLKCKQRIVSSKKNLDSMIRCLPSLAK